MHSVSRRAMLTVLLHAVFLVFTLTSSIVVFLAERCARRLSFLGHHLPWTMRRGQASATDDTWTGCRSEPASFETGSSSSTPLPSAQVTSGDTERTAAATVSSSDTLVFL